MGNTKPAAPDIRLEVTVRPSPYNDSWSTRYVHFTARVMIAGTGRFGDVAGRPVIVAPDSSELPYDTAVRAYTGLVITAQADDSSLARPGSEFYGWHVGYESSTPIDLDRMETAVKVLRKIRVAMDKLEREVGRPLTISQFAAHAARGVTANPRPFLRPVRRDQDDYEGTGYRSMSASDMDYHVSSECTELRKKFGIEIGE